MMNTKLSANSFIGRYWFSRFLPLTLVILAAMLTVSCTTTTEQGATTPSSPEPRVSTVEISNQPLINVDKDTLKLAQMSLHKLGYSVGTIDGIWGPRSAAQIQQFEFDQGIKSAGGFLSELNLDALKKHSGLIKLPTQNSKHHSFISQLNGLSPNQGSPKLVIVDRPYRLHAKPNPFSEVVETIEPGNGIYILSHDDGWYKVESSAQQQGYILLD